MRRERRRAHRSPHTSLSELNITPLLDLVFVLLVIFIIATPQLINNLSLNLPDGKPQKEEKPQINTVAVDRKGEITFNERAMTLAQLRQTLTQMNFTEPNSGFVVHGAAEADYQKVVSVLDVFQQLHIKNIGLATEPDEER